MQSEDVDIVSEINRIFHKYESLIYDRKHREIWDRESENFERILSIVKKRAEGRKVGRCVVLDVGTGTGFSCISSPP